MSLLHATLNLGRGLTASRYTETVTVGRFTDGTDPLTGDPTRVLDGAASYSGPGQIKYPSMWVADTDHTSQPVSEQNIILKLPSGTVVHVGEEVDVIASTVDASLVGARYKIDGTAQKGQSTSARYPVTEIS